jgi:hypothetical protein
MGYKSRGNFALGSNKYLDKTLFGGINGLKPPKMGIKKGSK